MIPRWLSDVFGVRPWCVAGGYAACPALASDIDVFVYGITDDAAIDAAREALATQLQMVVDDRNVGRPRFAEKRFAFELQALSITTMLYESIEFRIEKVGYVTFPGVFDHGVGRVKPVHIMVTSAPDPGSLISSFDVSTHAVAIDFGGRVWTHNLFTGPHQKPAVMRVNPNTQPRLDRICERFGHQSFPVDLVDNVPF